MQAEAAGPGGAEALCGGAAPLAAAQGAGYLPFASRTCYYTPRVSLRPDALPAPGPALLYHRTPTVSLRPEALRYAVLYHRTPTVFLRSR